MWTEHRFDAGWGTLNYAQGPAGGPPLAMLHGVMRSWQTFLPIAASLSTRYEILALDHRGHGRSDRTEHGFALLDYARDAQAWLAATVREPVVLYGHSLGAMVAALVAANAPELVRGVVLEDPPWNTLGPAIGSTVWLGYFQAMLPWAGSQLPVAELAKRLADVSWLDPASGRTIRLRDVRDAAALRMLARSLTWLSPHVLPPVVAGNWFEGLPEGGMPERLARPALLLWADEAAGGMLGEADVERFRARCDDLCVVHFAGASHNLHSTRPAEVLQAVYTFAESLD